MKYLLIIFFLSLILVSLWFRHGFLFAGAEEQLSFYNYSKSLNLFSSTWYIAGTGYPTLTSLSRISYFLLLEPLYKMGIPNVLLEAVTFFILILIGIFSVYYLIKETIASDLQDKWQGAPFLAALFYFLNPFSMTQIWGRALSYQFFSFALVPSFLFLFVLSLKKKNLIFCIVAALLSFFLSNAYLSPAIVLTSWGGIIIYLVFFLYINRRNRKAVIFSLISFTLLLLLWISVNLFWIYPTIVHGREMLTGNLTARDNIESLKGLSPNSVIQNVIRLIHREYYDGTYPIFFNSYLVRIISWMLPLFILFAIPIIKRSKYFLFFVFLSITSVFITIGANFPTGGLLIWLFKTFPILQVLRNPYEKFGINLVIAFTPFFAFGLIQFSDKLAKSFRSAQLKSFFISLFVLPYFIILVWPYWNGSFAGGTKTNFWIQVPKFYSEANNWLNNQPGDFRILHLPLIPEEGVTYMWLHPYEGVETSEFLFDKSSIARNTGVNKDYYSALLENFDIENKFKDLPNWSDNNKDFKEDNLINELAKLNIRYIVVHSDTDFEKRGAKDPIWVENYLDNQKNIQKVKTFGELDIYQVNIPDNIQLIYSPNSIISYRRINSTEFVVDVKEAKGPADLYFLEQYHPNWEAYVDSVKIESHSKIFSYANSWLINKGGNYQVNIKYKPQASFNFAYKISLVSTGALLITLIIYFLKTRNKLF